jgi:hypothetical protein
LAIGTFSVESLQHVGELDHGVAFEFGQGDGVVQAEEDLLGGLVGVAQHVTFHLLQQERGALVGAQDRSLPFFRTSEKK